MDEHSRFERRSFLVGAASLAGALAAPATGIASEGARTRPPFDQLRDRQDLLLQRVGKLPPINLARVAEVLEQHDLQGLVLGEPLNVFHATGDWPFLGKTRPFFPPTTLAVVSRDPHQNPALVTSKFLYYYTFADGVSLPVNREVFLYTDGPEDPREFYPDRGEVPTSEVEIKRRKLVDAAAAQEAVQVGVATATITAMKALGLWHGRIGYDRVAIQEMCAHAGFPGQLIQADIPLAEIRIIKSPLEIDLMRRASVGNIDAIHAAVAQIGPGASYRDLRTLFYAEASRRGNHPGTLTVDRISNELADATLRPGQAFMIDAVSDFQGYHGDYGRTVFIGEPPAPMKRAIAASAFCWSAMREAVKPGVTYSELAATGRAALKKSGYPTRIAFATHSVGLMHHDEPAPQQFGVLSKYDIALRENMILSMECVASADTGVGGSAHYEDLLLITRDGAEPIHPVPDPIIQI